jgi:hypothetical protein
MKQFFLGFALCLTLLACASTPIFPYKFFHLSGNTFVGNLLGEDPKDDIPFSRCAPVNGKQQCVVVFYTELNALITDFKQTKSDLISCQSGSK